MRLIIADQMLDQPSVAAEHQCLRNRIVGGAEIRSKHIICGQAHGVFDSISVNKLANGIRRRSSSVVNVQAYYFNAALPVLARDSCKLRSFLTARRTPRSPKIHHNNLAAICRESDRSAINRANDKVLRNTRRARVRHRSARKRQPQIGALLAMTRQNCIPNGRNQGDNDDRGYYSSRRPKSCLRVLLNHVNHAVSIFFGLFDILRNVS